MRVHIPELRNRMRPGVSKWRVQMKRVTHAEEQMCNN